MEELKKSADAALSALKEAKAKQETTPETKKALEDKLNAIILDWNTQIGILESKAESDESQKADADTWRKTFDDFKKQYDAELQANQNEAQKEADAEQLKKSEETNKLATEITPKLGRYSTEELKALTKKSWKELWTDPKYIKTIQQIIIDTGAKHNSISDEILTNGIYGRGTIAGIKTLQKHLNTKYKANLGEPDGYIGPNTLKALLEMDGDKTRLEKIIADHSDITPLPPESIKSVKAKKKATGGVGTVGISKKPKTDPIELPIDGTNKQKTLTQKDIDKQKLNLYIDTNNTLQPKPGYHRKNLKDKNDFTVEKNNIEITITGVNSFIKEHKQYFNTQDFNTETESILDSILTDGDKKGALESLLNLNQRFWKNRKLGKKEIQLLYTALKDNKLDSSNSKNTLGSNVFQEHKTQLSTYDDYIGLKITNGKKTLVRHGDIGGQYIFEVDGTGNFDDERFDSVESFFMRLDGNNIKNISEIEDENKDITIQYEKRFDSKIDKQILKTNIGAIINDEDKKNTFLGLLNLDDNFWGNYKLTLQDIENFKKGITNDTFDFSSSSESVFHEYNSDKHNDYNTQSKGILNKAKDQGNKRVFEVDGTGNFDDERFDSVKAFFVWLQKQ